jgi:hypothetical protein
MGHPGEMLRFFASLRMTIVVLRMTVIPRMIVILGMTDLDHAKWQSRRPAGPSAAKAVFIGVWGGTDEAVPLMERFALSRECPTSQNRDMGHPVFAG